MLLKELTIIDVHQLYFFSKEFSQATCYKYVQISSGGVLPSLLRRCWLGNREGHLACKKCCL